MNAYFHSQIPSLVKADIFCYYFCFPLNPMQSADDMKGMVAGSCFAPSQSAETLAEAMAPLETYLKNAAWDDKIYAAGTPIDYPDFTS